MEFPDPNNQIKLHIGMVKPCLGTFDTKIRINYFIYHGYNSSNLMVNEHDKENKNRPDYKVDIYKAYEYAYTNVYGKLNRQKTFHSHYLLTIFTELQFFAKTLLINSF